MADVVEDPVERLAAYRPTNQLIDAEWSPADQARMRAGLLAMSAAQPGRLRFVPRRRWAVAAPISAAAVVALMIGIALVATSADRYSGPLAGGTPFVAGNLTPTPRVGAGEYAYRVTESVTISADGTAEPAGNDPNWATPAHQQVWVAPDGAEWNLGGGCFPAPKHVGFDEPTQAFFDQMPTDPTKLEQYLRSHVEGSSSQDEAIFVAAGDSLRNADLLASSQLRAAWVEVMSHSNRVTVHTGVRDYLDRPAVRVDFVDQTQRAGELSSLYFDPETFQLLEERWGKSGAPDSYDGPSPAYDSPLPDPQPATDDKLTGPAQLTVMTSEKVVDHLPADVQNCQ
jgi:hypothetical protein